MAKETFEKEDEKLSIDVPKEKRFLNTTSYDYSVDYLVNMMEKSKIVLEVPFQRQYVWKDDKASQLIESIIMNVPIPPLYFAEEEDGNWLVVDGLQRLNSLLRFFQNEFGLKKLEILKDLEKSKFKNLPPKAKSLLEDGLLRVNVIKKDSHPDIKYDIFMRLNKGSVTLNYQELRNCLYRGSLIDLAKKLVKNNKGFISLLNLKEPHNRFLDVEFVIRYFALHANLSKNEQNEYIIKNYHGRMVTYLNNFTNDNKNLTSDKILEMEINFNNTISKVLSVFEIEEAFKDITLKTLKINRALADCILLGFSLHEINILEEKKDQIKQLHFDLLKTNKAFRDSISQRTSDTSVLNYRINEWIKSLENVL